ncbi:flagellar biosynthetic protein FliR [Fodinicurvata fenggangensis]|uniref:flagellar biosynthetic protein FliR n=1 Tax=Fodinicurvata fenggangensis TaxID=1121830 RepID=UPI00047A4F3B|nr:flagellar biosynthetic protein FliR [Fodinicurvata fenggangensis]
MLEELLPAGVFAYLLVFARVGSAFILLPGIGETYINTRTRLALALMVTLVVSPVLAGTLPAMPAAPMMLLVLLAGEIMIGVFLGTLGRLFINALNVVGMIVAQTSAMANALVNDPVSAQQASIASGFLTVTALLLIFILEIHHLAIEAVVASYDVMRPGEVVPVGDMADMVARTVADTFVLAVKMSAPFIAVAMFFYVGLGLLSRLMPQMQVFFIALPLQIVLGLMVLMLSLPIIMRLFLGEMEQTFISFIGN